MKISFSTGDYIKAVSLDPAPGLYLRDIPVGAEILACGLEVTDLKIFYGVKYRDQRLKERRFFIASTDMPLPREDFQYYAYIGTITELGLHVFEVA